MRTWKRRCVYFGASVVSVCRGMKQDEVTRFFGKGSMCVRSFDRSRRTQP